MAMPEFVDYSGAAPILLPVSLLPFWRGFYLPAAPDLRFADLEIEEGRFTICDQFDFDHPKTDYDRACALGGIPAIQELPVGPGVGLVFATELDSLTWWPEQTMLVNGWSLPDVAKLGRVHWSDETLWVAAETEFVLMNACEHGANPDKKDSFKVRLELGEYVAQWGKYGWPDDNRSMILFRLVLRHGKPLAKVDLTRLATSAGD
jgi:hypothetical protein